MLIYLIIFAIPALGIILNFQNSKSINTYLGIYYTFLIIIIGFRYEIGGDWIWYERNFHDFGRTFDPLAFNLRLNLGFVYINWILYKINLPFYSVNIVAAFIFILGVKIFIDSQKNKLLSLIILIPTGIIVMGMGFVRQGLAFSFILMSLAALKNKKVELTYLVILIGASFHKSILIFTPFIFLALKKYRVIIATILILILFLFYDALFYLFQIYMGSQQGLYYDSSKGVYVRMFMNFVPGILFLVYGKHLSENENEFRIYYLISLFVVLSIPIAYFYPTFIDRVSLYLIPIQVIVLSRFGNLFEQKNHKYFFNLSITLYYFIVMLVFLNYGLHSRFWVPYKFLFFQ